MWRFTFSLLRYLRAVLWSFFGIRRGAAARGDLEGDDDAQQAPLRPLPLLVTAVVVAAIFVFLLLGLARLAVAAPAVPDTLGQRLQACAGCHGAQGGASREGYVPRIAGKPQGYLFQQLLNFRDGRRKHEGMALLLENLNDPYLEEIAAYFADQHPPLAVPRPDPGLSAEAAARAQGLVRLGDAARDLPACAACHGERLTGTAPGVPGLLGLPSAYLAAQLSAWRAGQRTARKPDCMAQITQRIREEDIAAVARWLAAQPLPAKAAASETAPPRWPMQCGGINP